MSRAGRARVRAVFAIGPWVPGAALPAAVGLVGIGASALVLSDVLLPVGLVLAVVAALRVRSAAPWLLVAVLVLGRLLHGPAAPGAELPALLALVHLIAVLTTAARAVPVRSRLALAALLPAARALVLVQVPAQAVAVLLLVAAGRLQVAPAAAAVGAGLLVLVTALLVVPRRADEEEEAG